VEGSIERIAPLVEELQQFCRGHVKGDRGAAAVEMRAYLRDAWPDIPEAHLPSERDEDLGAEQLALVIIRDVGEMAGLALEADKLEEALAWARANSIFDLRRYLRAIE
jgi:hypothetical protein